MNNLTQLIQDTINSTDSIRSLVNTLKKCKDLSNEDIAILNMISKSADEINKFVDAYYVKEKIFTQKLLDQLNH